MTHDSPESALARLLSLADETRRRIYSFVAGRGRAVSRDEVAGATGVSRPLAAYHLDRLLDDGLLTASYQRPAGRAGPGAGRPAKLYTRAAEPLEVSLPRRDYELLAGILADAVAAGGSRDACLAAAEEHGAALARAGEEGASGLRELLRARGYEPYEDNDGCTRLRNCLFEREAATHRDLVCNVNLALVKGMLRGAGETGEPKEQPFLDPADGRCCVALAPKR